MNDAFRLLASYYMSLMEGDTHKIDDAFELLRKHGFLDEDDEWVDEEDA